MQVQLGKAKAEGIVFKLIGDMPPSYTWDAVKKRLCQVFSPVTTTVHVATEIHSRPSLQMKP